MRRNKVLKKKFIKKVLKLFKVKKNNQLFKKRMKIKL